MQTKNIFLSYIIDEQTPTYGNRNKFEQIKKSDIAKGNVTNDTVISSTVHIGTHIDMPYHFFEDGQTIKDYAADFWIFSNPLIIEINQSDLIINKNLIDQLDNIKDIGYDILIVKTSICDVRNKKKFWNENYGFSPNIANYLRNKFSNIRVFGFDSISVASFQERMIGKEAHKSFLDPKKPILLLEDMNLRDVDKNTNFKEIVILPLRISNCDGLPCAIIGRLYD